MRRLATLLAAALAWGCMQPPQTIRSETFGTSDNRSLEIRKVAIAPFRPAELYRSTQPGDPSPEVASRLIERFVTEALLDRGIEVVPAGDVRTALRLGPSEALPPIRIITRVAHQEFGVPAVVQGTVHRMRERGQGIGPSAAASVWFDVDLYRAPGGTRLWRADFNETQQPLGENVLNARRYPGGGTRWLRADELARWGARALAKDFPAGAGTEP